MTVKQGLKRIGWGLAIVVAVVLVLNFDFFWKNLKFFIIKPNSAIETVDGTQQAVKLEPNILQIDSLGIKAPIIYVQERSEKVYQEALQKGVVHFPGTAKPGEYGNCYIFGHSSDYRFSRGDYKTVFALLPRVEKGAKILVTDSAGTPFIYTVKDKVVAGASDVQYLDQKGLKSRILTLQTSYPIGTALKRYIVIAELTPEGSPNN